MILSAIAAVSDNFVIGQNGQLPWQIPEDLQRFKAFTQKKWLIMGRKTWISIGERPLPGRETLVVSRSYAKHDVQNARVVRSLNEGILIATNANTAELVVVGGTQLYAEALPLLDVLSLTRVHMQATGDAYFPKFSGKGFQLRKQEPFESGGQKCTYEEWVRAA